ncbi:MAG: sensor histidine kinase [Hyphomicrobiaceae bacterium]
MASVPSHQIGRETRHLLVMVGKVAFIIFLVEALIMMVMFRWDVNPNDISLGVIDATALTIISSPLIYLWVARPFDQAARKARAELSGQLDQTKQLLALNETLRAALQASSETTAETNESLLQKIGAELHDGPAQLLAFTLLKLDRLGKSFQRSGDQANLADLQNLREVMAQALREVRELSTGLSLPELASTSIAEAIELAVQRHQEATSTLVSVHMTDMPGSASLAQKICVYRLIQEALSNAFKHAQGSHVKVTATGGRDQMSISVTDNGRGFDPQNARRSGLGLPGMRARVHAIGGRFDIVSNQGSGTAITASFNLKHAMSARPQQHGVHA